MTKSEIKKIGNEIIDFFVNLVGFEKREDIELCVQDEDAYDSEDIANTEINHRYKTFVIRVYTLGITGVDELTTAICHELAHVFIGEMHGFYTIFVGDDDEETASWQIFRCNEERIAMRIGHIMESYWKLVKGARKSKV